MLHARDVTASKTSLKDPQFDATVSCSICWLVSVLCCISPHDAPQLQANGDTQCALSCPAWSKTHNHIHCMEIFQLNSSPGSARVGKAVMDKINGDDYIEIIEVRLGWGSAR